MSLELIGLDLKVTDSKPKAEPHIQNAPIRAVTNSKEDSKIFLLMNTTSAM